MKLTPRVEKFWNTAAFLGAIGFVIFYLSIILKYFGTSGAAQ
jgi:hypothetical protein